MKSIFLKRKFFLLVAIVSLFISCSAEDGADGMDGAPGQDGNANVTSVVIQNFELVAGNNEISIPDLSSDIANTGLVLGYISGTNGEWFSLPFSELVEVVTEDGTTATSTIVLEVVSIEPGKLVVFSLIEGTVDLRFVLAASAPSSSS